MWHRRCVCVCSALPRCHGSKGELFKTALLERLDRNAFMGSNTQFRWAKFRASNLWRRRCWIIYWFLFFFIQAIITSSPLLLLFKNRMSKHILPESWWLFSFYIFLFRGSLEEYCFLYNTNTLFVPSTAPGLTRRENPQRLWETVPITGLKKKIYPKNT